MIVEAHKGLHLYRDYKPDGLDQYITDELLSLKITNKMLQGIDLYVQGMQSQAQDDYYSCVIKLQEFSLVFDNHKEALSYLEILSKRDVESIDLRKDYPELFV